jgi:catechol 2,3-dioxygenase
MATLPLDVQGVLSALDGGEVAFEQMPRDTTMGHVHLQVADIPAAEAFYTEQLGFDVQARYGDQASFLSAGGYHHHLGGNVWNSRGAPPPPPGSAALRHYTVLLPDEDEVQRVAARMPDAAPDPSGGVAVKDPSKNTLILAVDPKN